MAEYLEYTVQHTDENGVVYANFTARPSEIGEPHSDTPTQAEVWAENLGYNVDLVEDGVIWVSNPLGDCEICDKKNVPGKREEIWAYGEIDDVFHYCIDCLSGEIK